MFNVTGENVKIFRKERDTKAGGKFTTYSAMVSSKAKDESWVYGYIDCAFKKDVEVNNKAKININSAFFTASKYNDKTYVKLMITDFDVVEEGEAPVNADIPTEDFISIPDGVLESEVPFM